MGESKGQAKIDAVKAFYRSLGVDTLAEEAINAYYNKAISELEKTSLNSTQKAQLEKFASTLVKRQF